MGSITGKPGTISEDTLRNGVFKAMFILINNNKPTGWTVQSVSPLEPPKFPTIVINPVETNAEDTVMTGSFIEKPITILIEFYARDEPYKKAKIDEGKDNVQATIEGHLDEIKSEGLQLDSIDDVESNLITVGRQKINAGALQLNMRLK